MPIETGPARIGPSSIGIARAIGAVDPWAARTAAGGERPGNGIARSVGPVVRSAQFAVGPIPVDSERVQQIRRAIEQGTYPLVPAKVADAMIAAGMLLRTGA